MGEFWTRYFLQNGRRMSKRQMKKITKLEKEIMDCIVLIDRLEMIIDMYSDEIDRIKKGGQNNPKKNSEIENTF